MKLSPVTWERWHHHFRVETVLLCSWTAPGRLFHNQSTVSDYRLWRTQSRPWGQRGRLHWHYHAQQDCTKTTDSLIVAAWTLMRLSHVAKPNPLSFEKRSAAFTWLQNGWIFFLSLLTFSQSWFDSHLEPRCIACYKGHSHTGPPCEPDGLCVGRLSSWPWNKVQIGAIFDPGLGGSLDCNI